VPEEELQETAAVVQDVMENAFKMSIPLKTEARSGPNWGEMEPLDTA
jgi:DNA polymerase-1